MRYSASHLREPARIYSVTTGVNDDFEEVDVLTLEAEVRGDYVPQPGRETLRAEQVTAEPRALFVIRYRDWVTEHHRIEIRGMMHAIHSVVDVGGRRRYLELVLTKKLEAEAA